MKTSFTLSSKNNRGSAFVQALIAISVVGIVFYNLSPLLISQRKQMTKTASIITARLAMHSMVDFTLFGIKQRWCFSETWMPEACGKNTPATTAEILQHPRSVERIIMKTETVKYLTAMGFAGAVNAPLSKISQTIPVSSFTTMHPLYKMIADLKGYKVSAFQVAIERDRRGVVPEYGQEVYLKVTVSLLDSTGKIMEVGSSRLTSTSFVGVYPREIGSFAVLVAGDLYLNRPVGGKYGDAFIPKTNSRNESLKSMGLVFESPVFVNGKIFLPLPSTAKDDAAEKDTEYAPVTFKEKVILGEGPVFRGNREFKPRSAGGVNDQFWSEIRQFGGFQKGVEEDGSRDLGLDFLSGKSTGSSSVDPALMKKCIDNQLAMTDLRRTSNSSLRARIKAKGSDAFEYRLGLTDGNRFNRQRSQTKLPTATKGKMQSGKVNSENGPIAKFNLKLGDSKTSDDFLKVEGEIPANGEVVIEPKIDLSDLESNLTTQLQVAQDGLTKDMKTLDYLKSKLDSAHQKLEKDQADLKEAQEKDKDNDKKISELQKAVDDDQSKISNLQTFQVNAQKIIDDDQKKVDAAQAQLTSLQADMKLQPAIHLAMIDLPNPRYKDLKVSFTNGNVLVDKNGKPLPIKIKVQAYDVSYDRGNSLRTFFLNRTSGQFRFDRSADKSITSEDSMYDDAGVSQGDLPAGDVNEDLDRLCVTQGNNFASAFGGTDWSTSFAPVSSSSWSFTNSYADRTNYVFDGGNARMNPGGGGTATFTVKSMARDCIITSAANFVTGFFTCQRLVIQSRSTPLRIIGTFIVTNGFDISPDAIKAGIRWSSIYHPMATFELRQAGVLRGYGNASCDSINRYPVWHPYPSLRDVANLHKCNAISLRTKADPFRWTSVDPDCGLIPGSNSTVCKKRLIRFFVLEVSRESGI